MLMLQVFLGFKISPGTRVLITRFLEAEITSYVADIIQISIEMHSRTK